MINRRVIAVTAIMLGALLIGGFYYASLTAEPKSTGGDRLDIAPPEYYTELNAMEKLNSELPLITGQLTITFDYSQGKYIVTSNSGVDAESAFSSWHASEPYSMIPKDRFLIK